GAMGEASRRGCSKIEQKIFAAAVRQHSKNRFQCHSHAALADQKSCVLSYGHGGCSVPLRLMPRLIVFALLLGLGAGAGVATAREAVLLPASCEYRGDRLVVQASRPK